MIVLGFIALAIAGTLLRALTSQPDAGFERHLWTTFGLNVAGSFLLGWLTGADHDPYVMVGVGGLGSLTTFSTFIWQVECIANRGGTAPKALAFAALSVSAGLTAAAIGYSL